MAKGEFAPGRHYRADRLDVDARIPLSRDSERLLAFCRSSVLRANRGTATADAAGLPLETMHGAAAGDSDPDFPPLHLNACGDFQLMARRDWLALGGYDEFDAFSLHLDSLLSFKAYHAGLDEQRLPGDHCLYHIDHGGGWSPEAAASKSLDRTLEKKRLPRLSYPDLLLTALAMQRLRAGLTFHGEDWGLAGEDLPEEPLLCPLPPGSQFQPAHGQPTGFPPLAASVEAESSRAAIREDFDQLLLLSIVAEIRRHSGVGQRPVVLWGLGPKGRLLAAQWLGEGHRLAALIDRDERAGAGFPPELPLHRPEALEGWFGGPRPYVIVGCTLHQSVADQLQAMGYREERDYYAPF